MIRKSHTSSVVKDRYNKKAYDSILFRCPKGMKEKIKQAADAAGGESVNSYIRASIEARMKQENFIINSHRTDV